MPISIITRSYWTSELKELVYSLKRNDEIEKEVVAVCNKKDYDLHGINLILENSNRFEARITGIKNAQFDKVLLLDSDQVLEDGLLHEIENRNEEMMIIPEKSLGKGLTAKCLDDLRTRNEMFAKKNISPYVPVVPRYYKKEPLMAAIGKLPQGTYNVMSHEDSILYNEVYRITQNIGFSLNHIFNRDPKFITLIRKAFLYGKFMKSAESLNPPSEIIYLLNKLNYNALNIKELGFGKGYVLQVLRAFAYEFGRIL